MLSGYHDFSDRFRMDFLAGVSISDLDEPMRATVQWDAPNVNNVSFELKAGDIIYSGTPENVGPVVKGDVLLCKLEGLPDMSIRIV